MLYIYYFFFNRMQMDVFDPCPDLRLPLLRPLVKIKWNKEFVVAFFKGYRDRLIHGTQVP